MSLKPTVSRGVRVPVAVSALVVVLLALTASEARAGRYLVVQCDPANREFADARFEQRNGGDYGFERRCEEDEESNALQIHSITGAPRGHYGRISWTAPEGTRMIGIAVEARLRSDSGHQARLSFLNAAGAETGRIATGATGPGGFERYERKLSGGGRERFGASLACASRDGCRTSDRARAWIRSVGLTLDDRVAPSVELSGSILAPGWRRRDAALTVSALDRGSGVRRLEVRVGGRKLQPTRTFACDLVAGSAQATRMRPCSSRQRLERTYDTTRSPFVDGVNKVEVCARDYGADGSPGCESRFVAVDNAAPRVAFADRIDREDPELIRAPAADRHSGLASGSIAYRPARGGAWRELPTRVVDGELRARVDSASEPRGRYAFRAIAVDRAGNVAISTRRRNGKPMEASFPLREHTRLAAAIDGRDRATVDYGERPRLKGTLRVRSGRGIAGETVEVIERFDHGSSLEPIVHSLRTNRRGRFDVRLSRGPSRRIRVSYEGSRRYLGSEAEPLRLAVRGEASLSISRRRVEAGGRVVFRGSVGRFGARVPSPGKLVEVQVTGGGIRRYRTVREAFHTDRRGRFRMRYGFERFYSRPTRFRFRLKVTPESRWPYGSPTRSRARSLTVRPR